MFIQRTPDKQWFLKLSDTELFLFFRALANEELAEVEENRLDIMIGIIDDARRSAFPSREPRRVPRHSQAHQETRAPLQYPGSTIPASSIPASSIKEVETGVAQSTTTP